METLFKNKKSFIVEKIMHFLKIFQFSILILINLTLFAQKDSYSSYINIDSDIFGQEAQENRLKSSSFFYGSSFDYAVYEFSNILNDNLNNKKEQQRLDLLRQQSIAKLGIIKNQYSGYSEFPSVINDGWHSAIASDNINFCKDVKVLVKNNRIIKFVIDNYIPLNFMVTGQIKNAKNVVTLNNFNGEQLNIIEVYFIYDIEEQTIVPEPIRPGYVCFWTDINNYSDIQLRFDNVLMEKFTVRFEVMPDCFSNGMVCRILKPGTYSFVALGKGAIDWEGTIEIKENMCLRYRLGR